jgi:hypothetical protein
MVLQVVVHQVLGGTVAQDLDLVQVTVAAADPMAPVAQ